MSLAEDDKQKNEDGGNNNAGAGDDDEDSIDDEEEGGEWITKENLHKHLTNGLMLPINPVEAEEGKEELV